MTQSKALNLSTGCHHVESTGQSANFFSLTRGRQEVPGNSFQASALWEIDGGPKGARDIRLWVKRRLNVPTKTPPMAKSGHSKRAASDAGSYLHSRTSRHAILIQLRAARPFGPWVFPSVSHI